MTLPLLPPRAEMLRATLARDGRYAGVFVIGVMSTGIFCRPGCPARSPHPENITFFARPADAVAAGYRACLRCRPLEAPGAVPGWLAPVLDALSAAPGQRIDDAALRALGVDPVRVRRWFRAQYGQTFQAFQRGRRLAGAQAQLSSGADLTQTAFAAGFDSLSGFRDAFRRLFGAPPGAHRGQTVITVTRVVTPLGPMVAGAGPDGIVLLEFADPERLVPAVAALRQLTGLAVVPGEAVLLDQLAGELSAYFAGALRTFSVPVSLQGTDFQRRVWQGLLGIPFGATSSYAALAAAIGRPGAQRAVGLANGQNRIAILVPCHRVIGASGRLTGYGGGLWRKHHLLALERGAGLTGT